MKDLQVISEILQQDFLKLNPLTIQNYSKKYSKLKNCNYSTVKKRYMKGELKGVTIDGKIFIFDC